MLYALPHTVAPVRERGLKCTSWFSHSPSVCRSREGAWIEIVNTLLISQVGSDVAPVRERGLKYSEDIFKLGFVSRSREGAWIEISL